MKWLRSAWMWIPRSLFLLPIFGVLGGCQSFLYSRDAMPYFQMKKALATDSSSDSSVGHLTRAFEPDARRATAHGEFSSLELTFIGPGVQHDLCIAFESRTDQTFSVEHEMERKEKAVRKLSLVFNARDGLDDLNEKSEWPSKPPSQITSVHVLDGEITRDKWDGDRTASGAKLYSQHMTNTVVVCVRAPVVTPTTKFITLTFYSTELVGAPTLYVWALDATADSVATGDATGGGGDPHAKPLDKDDVLAILSSLGNANVFARALEDTPDVLALLRVATDAYTIFVPTDDAFDALGADKLKALLADKARVKAMLLDHLVDGSFNSNRFLGATEKAPTTLTSRSDKPLAVKKVKGVLYVGHAKILRTDAMTDDGVIHVVDQVIGQ